ncbi:hypothetical protein KIN20_005694 [Parelaphostrongylus tenuis]|uniref:Exonuclease domain-containing protein n=1 Tax=Parelaphostrongylus tenuis TaxID=148309 RepID=A0AAD5M4X5_PARTN|nr:hypothetical protein KIN20_005694 [Parelaphostrongylus tenuis]
MERLGGVLISHKELRELVQYTVIGPVVCKPKWAHFRPWKSTSQTVVIRVDLPDEYLEDNEFSFSFIDEFFEKQWIRMDSEVSDRESFWKHMMYVPVSIQEQIRERVLRMDPLEGVANGGGLKTELLITSREMVDNEYPFPDDSIIPTKDKYASVTKDSPVFALDCEMCVTSAGLHELTRISVVREDGSVVLDTLVKPYNEITDYLTKFSGVTPELMESVTTSLEDVQAAIRAILPPDAILCGHSLEFDLRSMRMAHPYCIDIGLAYNLSGDARRKTSLKNLVALFFDEEIQNTNGHCSVEDAWCAMRLLQLKFEKGLVFGNCRYGWQYVDWFKSKGQESDKVDECEQIPKKRSRLTPRAPHVCDCGQTIGVDCIIECCQCQKFPPSECVKCLAINGKTFAQGNFDWSKALRGDYCSAYRPLSYYLVDSRKTVLCAFPSADQYNIQQNKIFKLRRPESFSSISAFVDEVSCDLLEYGLALIEMNYLKRQEEYSSEEDEDGEVCDGQWRMQRAVHELDGHIEKIIRAAARFSLIIVVMSSEKSSICYLKVKH